MRIGIDGRYQGQQLTGVPRYIHEVCHELDKQLPEAEFFLYALDSKGIAVPSSRWTLRCEGSLLFKKLKPNLWWKTRTRRLIEADRLDVMWAAGGLLPQNIAGLRTVLTVYDLTFRLFPETMSRSNRIAHEIWFRRDLLRATRVLTISKGTGERLKQYYGRPADAIALPAAGRQFKFASKAEKKRVQEKYQLNHPFLLAVSTLEPRKNLISLIQAFVAIKQEGGLENHELVLVGKTGWKNAKLSESIATSATEDIRSLGFVPDEDLPALYSACALFCMPSLYEGFGMPVLEAVSSGASVLTTDSPELREAGGDNCFYCEASPEGIKGGIKQWSENSKNNSCSTSRLQSSWSWSTAASVIASILSAESS